MIKIIIGKNASGKTLYLRRYAEEKIENNKDRVITNFDRNKVYASVDYNQYRLDLLKEKAIASEIVVRRDILIPLNSAVYMSKRFLDIITLLCKEADCFYLDEPEKGLSEGEICLLFTFLLAADRSYKELIMVTHSEVLADIVTAKVYTVIKNDKTSDLELIPVEEDKVYDIVD